MGRGLKIRGFTLIELLVVIAIIGLLSSVVLSSLSQARLKAQNAAAQSDLQQIYKAFIASSYDQNTEGINLTDASVSNRWHLPECGAPYDFSATGDDWPNGHYVDYFQSYLQGYLKVPVDPWGNRYIIDAVYICNPRAVGCRASGTYIYALVSSGPSGGNTVNQYDSDNIVLEICRHS